jgi:hypothetical protein
MSGRKALALSFLLLMMLIPAAAASQPITFLAMNPDTEYCISVIFGENGRGEYTLIVDDPDYPQRVWVDTHRASFTSGPSNPVIVPVCFSTENRRVGDEVVLHFTLETPEEDIRYDYGICVSRHEDVDVIVSGDDPCKASSSHTDVFNADLVESEKYAVPGERVTYTLLLSSEFDMSVLLDRETGPKMNISSTRVTMPGEHAVDIVIDSPQEPADYVFTIAARAAGCDDPSCLKRVSGILHVAREPGLKGFRVELSPKNKNVVGIQAATFYITVHNFEAVQDFRVNVELDPSLDTDFNPLEVRVGKDKSKQVDFTVIPGSAEHKLYIIRAEAEAADGMKKTAESFLTVEEPVSDAKRFAEKDPGLLPDADDYANQYRAGANLDDWQDIQDLGRTSEDDGEPLPDGQPAPLNWLFIAAAVVAVASIIFFIYKRTVVARGTEQPLY